MCKNSSNVAGYLRIGTSLATTCKSAARAHEWTLQAVLHLDPSTCASLGSDSLKPAWSTDLSSASVFKIQGKHTIKTAVRGKAGSSLGQAAFEESEMEMLKCDFRWQPVHVDTAPLGQFSMPKAVQPKGLSA